MGFIIHVQKNRLKKDIRFSIFLKILYTFATPKSGIYFKSLLLSLLVKETNYV